MKHAIPTVTIILLCALLTPGAATQPRKRTPAKNPAPAQAHLGVQNPPSLAFFKGEWQMERNSFAKPRGRVAVWDTKEKVSIEQPMDGNAIQFRLWEGFGKVLLGESPIGFTVSHEYYFILKFNQPSGKYLLTVQTKMAAARENMAFEDLPLEYVVKDRQLVGEGKGTIGLLAITVYAVIKLGEPTDGHSWLITGYDSSGVEKDKYEIKFSPKKS